VELDKARGDRERPSRRLKLAYKLWLETEEGYVFGQGAFDLLKRVQEVGTISGAAREMKMSYRHAWGVLKKIEKRIGEPLLKTRRGGVLGGGGAELTQVGRGLMETYLHFKNAFNQICAEESNREGFP